MKKNLKVLILTNELNITCGVSSSIYSFLSNLPEDCAISFYLITGGGDAVERFRPLVKDLLVAPSVRHNDRSVLNFFNSIYLLIKYCLRNKINIIHSHTHYAANLGFIASKFSGIKTIQSIHGIIPEVGFLPHYLADKYIAVNEHILDDIKTKFPKIISRFLLIRVGYKFPDKPPIKSYNKIKIIVASRLIWDKGIDVFIEAVKLLPNSIIKNCEFLIAGSGENEENFRAMSFHTPIKFLGSVDQLEELLKETHIFIIPSRSKAEGFPTAIIQAALAGNLIISSNFWGADKILKDYYNSLLFECYDVSRLTELMIHSSTNLKEYTEVIQHGFNDFKEKFNAQNRELDMIKLYNEI